MSVACVSEMVVLFAMQVKSAADARKTPTHSDAGWLTGEVIFASGGHK